ncbi:MAG: M6 family metalloprotease domain-containing protein, partial [Desulfobulbaceae bacterium]|nr:M6 family metalloprotease domain-containing protein [Desulfobulbaceae bacterium]
MNKRGLLAVIVALCWLFSGALALALEAPAPGEIEHLRDTGELAARLEQARALGNHRIDPYLLEQALTKTKREVLRQHGLSPALIENNAPLPAPPTSWRGMPTTGSRKMFTLLIDFSDYPHYTNNSQAAINSALFGNGSAIPGNAAPYESLSAYYQRASYGLLDLSGGMTLGWYRPAYTRAAMAMTDTAREALIKEAIAYFKGLGQDFSQFDNNGDGTIDYFAVVWTGPDNGWANFWWGYQTSFGDVAYSVDGKRLGKYSWQWEYRSGSTYAGPFSPKVIIHETGHALGLPDYYDYDTTVGPNGGVGDLDMMDGNWGDHNSFSKWVLDWLTPTVVASGSQTSTLKPSGTFAEAVLVMPGATSGDPFREFFLAQNRYRTGNDLNYPTDGMLIWHVDARLNGSGTDYLYDNSYTAHKLLKLMQADGLDRIENSSVTADAAMYYQPGKMLTPSSNPSSNDYLGADTRVNVNGISQAWPQMSAVFSIGASGLLNVVKSGAGSGSVASVPAGISCGDVCSASFTPGSTVTLTATAEAGSIFAGWSGGGCSGAGSDCVVSLTADATVTAEFFADVVLNENFDSVTAPALPAGWQVILVSGSSNPTWQTNPATVHPAGVAAHSAPNLVYFNSYTAYTNATATLVSPAFNLTGVANGRVTFWLYRDTGYATTDDLVEVYLNTSSTLSGASLLGTAHRYDTSAGWSRFEFPLPGGFTGDTNYLLFKGVSQFGNDSHLDDISVVGLKSKITPVLSWATPAAISYGTALGSTQLNASAGGVAGTFVYTPAAGTVLNAGADQTLSVAFTPSNPASYNTPAPISVLITVNKAIPVLSWATPTAITYGTALSATQLKASAGGVAGTFVYTPAAGTVLNAGVGQTLAVTFTPNDTANYDPPAEKTVLLTVNKATPVLSWATPAAITYGTALSSSQLNASAAGVAGIFVYTPAAGTVLNVGVGQNLSVVFTPTDTANYNTPAAKTVKINVAVASQSISFGAAPSLTYGAPGTVSATGGASGQPVLFSSLTTAVCTVSGNTVTPVAVGTCTIAANQAGTTNFTAAPQVTQSFPVAKATPVLSWATPAEISYGTALSGSQLNASAGGVAGTFTYTPAAGTVLNAGVAQTLAVTFTPSNTANYKTPSPISVLLTVNKATPVLSWATPTAITYKTALSASQLKASAGGVAGTFVYTPAAGTVLNAGANQTLSVTFTPSNTANYNIPAPASVLLTVNKATPVVSWATPAAIPYGTALGASQLNAAAGGVAGTFVYTPAAGTVLNVGSGQILAAAFTPTDTANYNTPAAKNVLLTVTVASQSLSFGAAPVLTYGGAPGTVSATGGASGQPVLFSSLTTAVCTVSGSTVTPVAAGTCTIAANQAGTANYTAAPQASQSFPVAKATPLLSWAT